VRGGVVTTVTPAGTLPTGAAVPAALGALAAGAGAATGVETGEVVTGVTTSFAVMEPLTLFFCFLDDVVSGGRPDPLAGNSVKITEERPGAVAVPVAEVR
jgi:hypothetical protein